MPHRPLVAVLHYHRNVSNSQSDKRDDMSFYIHNAFRKFRVGVADCLIIAIVLAISNNLTFVNNKIAVATRHCTNYTNETTSTSYAVVCSCSPEQPEYTNNLSRYKPNIRMCTASPLAVKAHNHIAASSGLLV